MFVVLHFYRETTFLWILWWCVEFNTLRPRQNGRHFADDTFRLIFLNENVKSATKISLKFVPMGPINNIPALVQIMAWRRPGDKPLSEPMMVRLLTHICVTRPQWVNSSMRWIVSKIIKMYSYFVSYLGFCSTEEDQIHDGATLRVAYPIP